MAEIMHRVGIKTNSIDHVYRALTTRDGLAGWWTSNTQGEGDKVGNIIQFRFGAGGFDMRVKSLDANKLVEWELKEGPEEWMPTTIQFELRQDGDYVIVMFRHFNWKERVEFMHHCSTKWGVFLISLKYLVETGKGKPDPEDIKIDNWN